MYGYYLGALFAYPPCPVRCDGCACVCLQVTPGKRAPTVSPLDVEGWVAVQALILKKESSRVMDALKAAGATDVLIFSLQNTRM